MALVRPGDVREHVRGVRLQALLLLLVLQLLLVLLMMLLLLVMVLLLLVVRSATHIRSAHLTSGP